jgi:hypothetical protein
MRLARARATSSELPSIGALNASASLLAASSSGCSGAGGGVGLHIVYRRHYLLAEITVYQCMVNLQVHRKAACGAALDRVQSFDDITLPHGVVHIHRAGMQPCYLDAQLPPGDGDLDQAGVEVRPCMQASLKVGEDMLESHNVTLGARGVVNTQECRMLWCPCCHPR